MLIGLDFDETVVLKDEPVPHALPVLKELSDKGFGFILITLRTGDRLKIAEAFLKFHGINLVGVNENPEQKEWNQSPKIHCDFYIDDRNIGTPLLIGGKKPVVNWIKLREELVKRGLL
jgi:hypothetical protein